MESSGKIAGCIYFFTILYLVAVCSGTLFQIIHKEGDLSLYIYAIVTVVSISIFLITIHFINKKNEEEVSKLNKLVREHEIKEKNMEHDYAKKKNELIILEEKYNTTLQNSNPFRFVAEMISDWETIVYDKTCHFLRTKKHPAIKKSLEVNKLKEKTRNIICDFKEMKYKYQFLLEAFPELKQYVDDAESLKYLADYKDFNEFKEERDEVLDWISPEEYKMMSENDRNQLALDRYKKAHKSEWQIGMQYEMYIGYHLRNEGFHVVQYGIEHGLEDLGRDIIATRMEDGM